MGGPLPFGGSLYPLNEKGDAYLVPVARWYGKYVNADGRPQRVPLWENKTVAQQILTERVKKAELAKVGTT